MTKPDEYIRRVTAFASTDDRIVAAALCGSHAAGTARQDSDIDIVLVANDPASLLGEQAWLAEFGNPNVIGVEDYRLVQSLRVYYGAINIEFGVTGLPWVQIPIDAGTAAVMRQPLRILYDPNELLSRAVSSARDRRE